MSTENPNPAPAGKILQTLVKDMEKAKVGLDSLQAYVDRVRAEGTVKADVVNEMKRIDAQVATIDRLLSEQLSLVLHDPNFQRLEGSWRGLSYMVFNSNTSSKLKIKLMDVSKNDLRKDLTEAADFDTSGLFRQIYEEQYGMAGGVPFGMMVGDYEFSNHPQDVELLTQISRVSAAAFAPFVTAANPELFGLEGWEQMTDIRALEEQFKGPDFVKWNAFRQTEEARFVGLTLPRTLARVPYGRATKPVEAFNFEESVVGPQHERYCWSNAAYSFAARVCDAFDKFGWCTSIRGAQNGGKVEGLPLHVFDTGKGDKAAKCPTEVGVSDRRESELAKLGFIPLCHYKDTDYAVFFSAQSAQKPKQFDLPGATANAALMSQLQYIMATARFAHCLKIIQRDNIGSNMELADVQAQLSNWIQNYVLLNPENAGPEAKARRPLREARIEVSAVEGKPGYYNVEMFLRPHFQLEGLDIDLKLVASLDRPKRATK